MKKIFFFFLPAVVWFLGATAASGGNCASPPTAHDPKAVADSVRQAEIAAEIAYQKTQPPMDWARVMREDSLIRVGYQRAGGEDRYHRWQPALQTLFDEFKNDRTPENKRKLMDFIAEHRMCLIVPKPFTDEMMKTPVHPHPRLIMWEPKELSEYLDLFIHHTRPEK